MAEHSILVVEDEHTLRRLLEYRLNKHYAVRTAANGEEALTLVEDEVPDLIVSDIMMPKMDGFALQKALQKDKDTRIIPFIFLTAKADESSRLKGLRMGVDDYITKPFDIEQLLTRIERLLERTKLFQSRLDARLGQDFSEKLMPKTTPEVAGYRVRFKNIPREQGGGDLLDWTDMDDGSILFTVGDVMGKGVQ
ncbi:MAG: response regulator, partial [Bacteroidetes bacterium]|nr:response regulator [Bacteroidota bacterium]